jgi:hypothetical protein
MHLMYSIVHQSYWNNYSDVFRVDPGNAGSTTVWRHADFNRRQNTNTFKRRTCAPQGYEPAWLTSEQVGQRIASDIDHRAKVVRTRSANAERLLATRFLHAHFP